MIIEDFYDFVATHQIYVYKTTNDLWFETDNMLVKISELMDVVPLNLEITCTYSIMCDNNWFNDSFTYFMVEEGMCETRTSFIKAMEGNYHQCV